MRCRAAGERASPSTQDVGDAGAAVPGDVLELVPEGELLRRPGPVEKQQVLARAQRHGFEQCTHRGDADSSRDQQDVARAGSDPQVAAAAAILSEARRSLYLLLADGPQTPDA
jgi:hypothetical protein